MLNMHQRHKNCGGTLTHLCLTSMPPQQQIRCSWCGKVWISPLFYMPPPELDPEEVGYTLQEPTP